MGYKTYPTFNLRRGDKMGIKELLETNPVLLTGVATSFIGICGALGIKELLMAAYNRYCKKADEKDTDHKVLMEIVQRLDNIEKRLDDMDANDREGLENDIVILEHDILFMQHKAIAFGKVSKDCMPQYRRMYRRYKILVQKSSLEVNEEAETNNEIVEKLFHDGKVVDSFWQMYK